MGWALFFRPVGAGVMTHDPGFYGGLFSFAPLGREKGFVNVKVKVNVSPSVRQ